MTTHEAGYPRATRRRDATHPGFTFADTASRLSGEFQAIDQLLRPAQA